MEAIRPFLSVVFVFALLGLALWALRRKGSVIPEVFKRAAGRSSRIKVLDACERLVLTPQHSLHLIRLRGKELLVATHPQGCSVLSALSASDLHCGQGMPSPYDVSSEVGERHASPARKPAGDEARKGAIA